MLGNLDISSRNKELIADQNVELGEIELTCLSRALGVSLVVTTLPQHVETDALKTAKVYKPACIQAPTLHLF